MTATRTAWGFTGPDPRQWVIRAVCRGKDPRMFDVLGRRPTAENRVALNLCASCPVRAACRDDYLTAPRVPLGLIAGGWWWDHSGNPHPHLADVGPAAAAPRRKVTVEPRVTDHVRSIRKAITAARAKLADPGMTYKEATTRYGSNFRAVSDAVLVARHAPDLLQPVWAGLRTLASAVSEANRRRTGSHQLEGAGL